MFDCVCHLCHLCHLFDVMDPDYMGAFDNGNSYSCGSTLQSFLCRETI